MISYLNVKITGEHNHVNMEIVDRFIQQVNEVYSIEEIDDIIITAYGGFGLTARIHFSEQGSYYRFELYKDEFIPSGYSCSSLLYEKGKLIYKKPQN